MGKNGNVYRIDNVEGLGLVVDRDRVRLRGNSFVIVDRVNISLLQKVCPIREVGYILILTRYVVGEFNELSCDIREVLGMSKSSYYRFMNLMREINIIEKYKGINGFIYVMNPYFCRANAVIMRSVLQLFNDKIKK
jgi:hypothetical protein